jgi:type I restriction enzyme S subunit
MAPRPPSGTTAPHGFPVPEQIRWPLVAARDLFELKYGRALVEADRRPGSVPVFGTNGRCGSHNRALFSGPGVILGRKGQGPLGVEWTDDDYWVIDTAYSLAPLRSDIDLKYSYFLIKHIGLNHLKDGTSNPTLSRDAFGAQAVPLPPFAVQRAIAHVLGTLDDKIELNRRMNETLEGIARAIFKSWFVDFDPVRAKIGGGEIRLPGPVSELFPARFVQSELGETPEGWQVLGLDDIGRFVNGLALQKYPPTDGSFLPVIKIAQLRAGHTDGADRSSADLEPDYVVEDGDILFSWSGSLECVLWAGGRGALNQHLFKVTSPMYPRWLCYFAIHEHLDEFRQIAAGKATTMGHIQRYHLSDAKLALPGPELLRAADSVLAPLIESIWRREVESRTLAQLRDTLLPKLISGELQVQNGHGTSGNKAKAGGGPWIEVAH